MPIDTRTLVQYATYSLKNRAIFWVNVGFTTASRFDKQIFRTNLTAISNLALRGCNHCNASISLASFIDITKFANKPIKYENALIR